MMNELILLSGTTPEEVPQGISKSKLRDQADTGLIRIEIAESNGENYGQCSVVSEIERCYLS